MSVQTEQKWVIDEWRQGNERWRIVAGVSRGDGSKMLMLQSREEWRQGTFLPTPGEEPPTHYWSGWGYGAKGSPAWRGEIAVATQDEANAAVVKLHGWADKYEEELQTKEQKRKQEQDIQAASVDELRKWF